MILIFLCQLHELHELYSSFWFDVAFMTKARISASIPLFPLSFPVYCQSPFHSLSFHSSLTPTSAGFINTFLMETNNLTKHHPLLWRALTGYFRVGVLECWTQCDQHFAHLYFLCCLFHLAWVDHAMDWMNFWSTCFSLFLQFLKIEKRQG